jgi:hypothetical protein
LPRLQEVLQTLLGRVPPRAVATLQGFARRALRERTYPGIEACEEGAVHGQARCSTQASAGNTA